MGGPVLGVGGNVFAPLFDSPRAGRAADAIVEASAGLGNLISPSPPLQTLPTGEQVPVGGAAAVPAAPHVLPMWLADP